MSNVDLSNLRDRLRAVCQRGKYWTELRYHHRLARSIAVRQGEVNDLSSRDAGGVGVRVLANGTWGFASTSDLTSDGLEKALKLAEEMASALSSRKDHKIDLPSTDRMAKGEFIGEGFDDLLSHPLENKFEAIRKAEESLRGSFDQIEGAQCGYRELFEEKIVVTSDGADAQLKVSIPEIRFLAFGADGTHRTMGFESSGVTGNWECLFNNFSMEEMIDSASKNAIELLKAPDAEGGKKKVILSPAMVGLLSHEAIGHTVEMDFVNAGSVAQGKLGEIVASPLVNLYDSGASEFRNGAGGTIPFDDEGVMTEKTPIIRDGKLVGYLHNRETAAQMGIEPTGNGRAWTYSDEPLIRMRNTYIEPGQSELKEMISEVEDGYFVDGASSGQADATGEFMFGAEKVRRIRNGELKEHVQKVTVAGNAFEVLKSVDGVSKEFQWMVGSGHCGKGQPAKVDAGGPYLRCEIVVGGASQ